MEYSRNTKIKLIQIYLSSTNEIYGKFVHECIKQIDLTWFVEYFLKQQNKSSFLNMACLICMGV